MKNNFVYTLLLIFTILHQEPTIQSQEQTHPMLERIVKSDPVKDFQTDIASNKIRFYAMIGYDIYIPGYSFQEWYSDFGYSRCVKCCRKYKYNLLFKQFTVPLILMEGTSDGSCNQTLMEMGSKAAIALPYLISALRKSPGYGYWAIEAINKINANPTEEIFIKVFYKEKEPIVRIEITRLLGRMKSKAKLVVPALVKFLNYQGEDLLNSERAIKRNAAKVRKAVSLALGNLGPTAKAAVPDLIERLNDEDEEKQVIMASIKALGEIGVGVQTAIPQLTKFTKSEDILISYFAEKAVKKISQSK